MCHRRTTPVLYHARFAALRCYIPVKLINLLSQCLVAQKEDKQARRLRGNHLWRASLEWWEAIQATSYAVLTVWA